MKKNLLCTICSVVAFLLIFASTGLSDGSVQAEQAFKKAFPNVPYDSIKPGPVKGIYEVSKGADLIYFFPENDLLFVGEIVDKTGRSLTDEQKGQLLVNNVKKIPLDKAVRIGSGKQTIIEFTDPDCPYCRRAAAFLETVKDITRYVFFFPLPSHKDAENKIKYIFCSSDMGKGYEDAMKGRLDTQKYTVCKKQEAADRLALHKEIGARIGVNGTPMFIINGKDLVVGANFPAMQAALGIEAAKPAEDPKGADTPAKNK
ncbi:MAG: DsbC family protein [Syntrophorhabdaceae bacterium]|nr:DsbC family protein [Syntrophorhabdaceae bacterium]MDD4196749.1 DsbC family protein [Syntrophorhabdaceae bacterium]HOC46269.1 DsbC family protein [Syntrophorhabdaceae bacterium]